MILRKMLLLVMCPFVGCRSKPQEESSKMPEHAVIVRFAYGRPELEPLFELEERLRGAIDEANVGEYDGNEIAVDGSEGILYMYGPDGDSLFETVRPVLESADFMNGATVVVRYGPPEDGVEERSVRIGGGLTMADVDDLAGLEDAVNATYPGLTLFARDVDLAPELALKYAAGLVIRERGFTDATPRFGGMVTTHRFVILSNHLADFDALLGANRDPQTPGWRLHVAARDSHFKVLGQRVVDGKTLIFLLHLPDDERWRTLARVTVDIDERLLADAIGRMEARLQQAPIPEVTSALWLDRCRFPLGMSDDGELFPLD